MADMGTSVLQINDETHPCAGYAHCYAEHFAEFQKNGQGLLLWGDVGTGKPFIITTNLSLQELQDR